MTKKTHPNDKSKSNIVLINKMNAIATNKVPKIILEDEYKDTIIG